MDGRENDYQWAGPYLVSRQVIAVSEQSSIERMSDLAGKTIACLLYTSRIFGQITHSSIWRGPYSVYLQ